jgi:phytanoyl-CoA hydroxylase
MSDGIAMSQPDLAEIARHRRFDAEKYRAVNPDLALEDEDLLRHWVFHGREEERKGLRPGWRAPQFDRDFYLRENPDVIGLIERGDYSSPEEHWILAGRDEVASGARDAFGDFDETLYLLHRPDVAEACARGEYVSGFDHWLMFGRREEREARVLPHLPLARTNTPGALSQEKQAFWREKGYVILEGIISPERCEAANQRINELWATRASLPPSFCIDVFIEKPECRRIPMSAAPGEARLAPYKINDLFKFDPIMRSLALDGDVCEALRWVLNGDAAVVGSLNFERGSTQRFHTDTLYMPAFHPGAMTAAWFALEDVTAAAGPLRYFPGSHEIPLFTFGTGNSYQVSGEMDAYDRHMDSHIARLGLAPQLFLPKRGDVLIWHERLYHGGEPIQDIAQTRKSLVCHYWRADLMPRDQVLRSDGGYYLDRPYHR